MRLKEIKPGMVISWKTEDEKAALLEELERLGYEWYGTKRKPTESCDSKDIGHAIYVYNDNGYKNITHSNNSEEVTHSFSDLIIPELSVEKVIQICTEICERTSCNECTMGDEHCFSDISSDKSKIIEICQKWKSDHEKKEQEVEWVYRVEIEETKQYSDWITEELAIEQCEKLSKETGKNATYRKICRVKAVN